MQLRDLLRETGAVDSLDVWENKCIPNILMGVGMRLHLMGLSVRETVAVLE